MQDQKTVVPEGTEMSQNSRKYLLLFLILVFAFLYRVMFMLQANYPPGADIGLHNSVIHSITPSGGTDFLWNNYQMGGGLSLTFPGYHIMVAQVIQLTGLPDFLAHTFVVALFSTLIVAIAFLITRKMWSESSAFIVAFLVAISRFDIEMLLWGGYPNVLTLLLIPVILYLFIQSERFTLPTFLITTSLLAGSLFLAHSLSTLVFDGIVLVFVVSALVFNKRLGLKRQRVLLWLAPIFLGVLIFSPFLVRAIPTYLTANSETFTGVGAAVDIRDALLSTRILPWEILVPLAACVVFFFLLSKENKRKFLTVPALLLTLWILVPVAFTQGYIVKFYIDYNRFLYFVLLPVIILIGLVIDHFSNVFAKVTDTYLSETKSAWQTNKTAARLTPHLTRKNFYAGAALASLLISFFAIQLFMTPWQGTTVQSFYQVMDNPGYDAIQWAKANTPTNSRFVSDALYGWWFGGFAQRPTISAVDPQYLTLARELNPARNASYLLDTDYVIDNGLIQVREDGGYVGRHNPMFLGKLNWTYFPYSFVNFKSDDTTISLRDGNDLKFSPLSQLQVREMKLENASDQAKLTITKGNDLLTFTEILTVYKNRKFVNVTLTMESAAEVSLVSLKSILHIRGEIPVNRTGTYGILEVGSKVLGQLIYTVGSPIEVNTITQENPSGLEVVYDLHGDSSAEIQMFISAFSVSDEQIFYQNEETTINYINRVLSENLATYLVPDKDIISGYKSSQDIISFDYKKSLADLNVSYVAVRDPGIIPKFARDPAFSLLFINDEVAVFLVK